MPPKHTKESFIKRSVQIHGDKFDYSLVEYVNQSVKVTITCPAHGDFIVTPKNHMKGRGCRLCGIEKRSNESRFTTEKFIKKALSVHGDRYDYSLVEYSRAHEKVKVICKSHGEFYQTAANHLRGQGCMMCRLEKCKVTKPFTSHGFIKRAKRIHGNRYDYSLVDYVNAHSKVKIVCSKHGAFEQLAMDHLQGKGCASCAKTGFNNEKCAVLYILLSECNLLMKVGISNNPKNRFQKLRKATPFLFNPIEQLPGSGAFVAKAEKKLHSIAESANLTGFDGCTEWFKYDRAIIDKAIMMFSKL